jgi:monoamine oxidase
VKPARRHVLAGLAGLAAAPALWAPSVRAQGRADYDTIVIGAGLSGLRTAMLLAEEGQRVLVLEATSRVGGRVFTLDALPGTPEAGANSLLAGYGRALDLAARLVLPMIDISQHAAVARTELVIAGTRIAVADWKNSPLNQFPQAYREVAPAGVAITAARKLARLEGEAWCDPANAHLDIGIDRVLREQGFSAEAINLAYNTNPGYGRSADQVSLLNLLFVSAFFAAQGAPGSPERVVKGGNSRLTEALARAMRAELRLDTPVAAVIQGVNGIEVRTGASEVLRASRVVCAVPLGPLSRISFDPPLPALHREATTAVPYMAISQAHLVADAPFWSEDAPPSLWTDSALGVLAANRGGTSNTEVTSFTAWSRGALAEQIDLMAPADAERLILEETSRAWPASRGRLRVAARHSWKKSPFQDGAWAVWRPGQATRLPRAVGLAHGRVHFCGEHSALTARGMEGALESAERVAVEVLLA